MKRNCEKSEGALPKAWGFWEFHKYTMRLACLGKLPRKSDPAKMCFDRCVKRRIARCAGHDRGRRIAPAAVLCGDRQRSREVAERSPDLGKLEHFPQRRDLLLRRRRLVVVAGTECGEHLAMPFGRDVRQRGDASVSAG